MGLPRRRFSIRGSSTNNTNNNVALIIAVIGVIGTLLATLITSYFNFQASSRPIEAMIEATETKEAKLTVLAPTSTNTSVPTLTPVPKQPFDVIVMIKGEPAKLNPSFPVSFPSLREITIEIQLTGQLTDKCEWNVQWALSKPTPEPQGCKLTFVPPTNGDTVINITVFTTDGNSLQRSLTFKPIP